MPAPIESPTLIASLAGAGQIGPGGIAALLVTLEADAGESLAALEASASGVEGEWQTLVSLATPGPVSIATGFDVTLPAFGGSADVGMRTIYLRASDTSGNRSTATLTVTYDPVLPTFADVPGALPDDEAEAIRQMAARGVVKGYSNGNFGPGDTIQRAQMAALIARAMGYGTEDWGNTFSDRNGLIADLWRNVGTLQHYGIALGYDGAACAQRDTAAPCFGPTEPVTRVQTISFIARAMVKRGYWQQRTSDPNPFPNVPASSGHVADLATYAHYVGAPPGTTIGQAWPDWAAVATRGWFAWAEWAVVQWLEQARNWGTLADLPFGHRAHGIAVGARLSDSAPQVGESIEVAAWLAVNGQAVTGVAMMATATFPNGSTVCEGISGNNGWGVCQFAIYPAMAGQRVAVDVAFAYQGALYAARVVLNVPDMASPFPSPTASPSAPPTSAPSPSSEPSASPTPSPSPSPEPSLLPSPSPSAIPSPLPSPSPSPSASPSPTASPSPSPGASPGPSPSPSSSPSPSPSPAPSPTPSPSPLPSPSSSPSPGASPSPSPSPGPSPNRSLLIGPGFSDVSPHQLVRTSSNVLYAVVPTCAYYPDCPGATLRVYRGDRPGTPTGFTARDVANQPAGAGTSAVAVDGDDRIHVFWIDRMGRAVYGVFDTVADRWGPQEVVDATNWTNFGQGDEGAALAVDATGVPHAAWSARGGDGKLQIRYASRPAGGWTTPLRVDDVPLGPNRSAWHPTLAFAPDGALLLAWLEGTFNYTPDGVVRVRERSAAGVWGTSAALPDAAMTAIDNGPSLLITADGVRHLTFLNTGNAIRYWYDAGQGWRGDRQPAHQVTHNPSLGPDGAGGVYIYGHGTPQGSLSGHGDNLYRFRLAAGATSWGGWDLYVSGAFDSSVGTRWAQFFHYFPEHVDILYWADPYPNVLYLGTE